MKVFYGTMQGHMRFLMLAMAMLGIVLTGNSQIFEPEGLNLPGTWNGFTNPPAAGSVFGSETQVTGGQVRLITTGTRRWQTIIHAGADGDVAAGDYTFLFTSGSTGNPFGNKWAGVNVVPNTLQNYVYNTGPDNAITLTDDTWYTVNWRDNGYNPSSAIFMTTSAPPVMIDSITTDANLSAVSPNQPIEVNAFLSTEPSPEEFFFIRYSVDAFATSVVVPMEVFGSEAIGIIPGFAVGNQIQFYVFSTTVEDVDADFDMHTLNFLNDEGFNFVYSIVEPGQLVNLGNDFSVCPGTGPWVINADEGLESYIWSNGATTSSITVNSPGTYWVEVISNGEIDRDSVTITLAQAPVVNLGADINVCGDAAIVLESGFVAPPFGNLLTIVYDATQGQSGLAGAETVYMHSTYEQVPFGGPVNPWVGNWGQDDGIGEMTFIGNNQWSITINPYEYYNIPTNAPISGLFIVFRNADGSETGKDNNGNDIFLNLQGSAPTSSFGGITASYQSNGIAEVLWSTGATTSNINVEIPGTYSVTVTNTAGCSASDTVVVTFTDVPELTLSNDTAFCGGAVNYPILAQGDFESFSWSNGVNTAGFTATAPGVYVVDATAANGCVVTDSVSVQNDVLGINLNLASSYSICGDQTLVLNPGVSITPQGDSLTIVYDATQGQSGLVGAETVYMHSSFEYVPFGGPVLPFVGNWGEDDGIGEMTSLGNNLWTITINVYDYYNIPEDSLINGLFMVFRNADGTQTGKDNNGNDIFLNMTTSPPSSSFGGVTATVSSSPFVAALWSNGATTPTLNVTQAGTYSVIFFGENGCNAFDTTTVSVSPVPTVNLGADRILCQGASIELNAGPGFASYEWSNGDEDASTTIDAAGAYSVTVANEAGCTATDVVNVLLINPPVAAFTPIIDNGLTVTFTDQSAGPANYFWDFNSDGTNDLFLNGDVSFTYPTSGIYNATLVLTNLCGSDTLSIEVDLSSVGLANNSASGFEIFPNPATQTLFIRTAEMSGSASVRFFDLSGKLLRSEIIAPGLITLDRGNLAAGMYLIEIEQGQQKSVARIVFE